LKNRLFVKIIFQKVIFFITEKSGKTIDFLCFPNYNKKVVKQRKEMIFLW